MLRLVFCTAAHYFQDLINTFVKINQEYIDGGDESDEDILSNIVLQNYFENKVTPLRIQGYCDLVMKLNSKTFQMHFRMSRATFEALLEKIDKFLINNNNVGRSTVDPRKQLLAVLWLLGTPDSYRYL